MSREILLEHLTRLKLKSFLETYEVRLSEAQQEGYSHEEFLVKLLQDEAERREQSSLIRRLKQAKFESHQGFEELDLLRYPEKTRGIIRELQGGQYLNDGHHVIVMGPTGTGKSHLAQALGNQACRKGYSVRFVRANGFLRSLHQARADHSWERVFKSYLSPKVLILDDFGLKGLSAQEAEDIYELVAERARKGSFIITSNRTVDAWVKLFPDTVMANAILDRVANNAHQLVLEGESYRAKNRPKLEATC